MVHCFFLNCSFCGVVVVLGLRRTDVSVSSIYVFLTFLSMYCICYHRHNALFLPYFRHCSYRARNV